MAPSETISLATLWKWASARTDSGTSVLMEIRLGKGIVLFAGRNDTEEGWRNLLGEIRGEPAETFLLESVGIPERLGLRDSGRAWNNLKAREWIEKRFRKVVPREKIEGSGWFPVRISVLEENSGKWVLSRTGRA